MLPALPSPGHTNHVYDAALTPGTSCIPFTAPVASTKFESWLQQLPLAAIGSSGSLRRRLPETMKRAPGIAVPKLKRLQAADGDAPPRPPLAELSQPNGQVEPEKLAKTAFSSLTTANARKGGGAAPSAAAATAAQPQAAATASARNSHEPASQKGGPTAHPAAEGAAPAACGGTKRGRGAVPLGNAPAARPAGTSLKDSKDVHQLMKVIPSFHRL